MKPVIRPLRPEDAAEVARLIEDARQLSSFSIGPNWTPAQIFSECAGPGWVMESEGPAKLAACLLIRDVSSAFEITYLVTAADARRQGRMSQLLGHLLQQLPAGKAVWLEVHEHNLAAQNLYSKFAFVEVGRRPKYYADGGTAILYNYG